MLVPGFWLGGWAWDDVAGPLRAAGHQVDAVTLPGLAGLPHVTGGRLAGRGVCGRCAGAGRREVSWC